MRVATGLFIVAVALLSTARPQAQPGELVVSAAASLADVMGELVTLYRAEAQVELRINTGGSNTLARQIVEGAPVDVFISADETQMDVTEKAGRLVPGSRADLLSNAIVVIVPAASGTGGTAAAMTARDLTSPAIRRVAMGNPESVPVGVYGRRWLETMGVWSQVAPKVVPLPTVRAALSAVQEGRVDAGIVYATDARVTDGVRVALVAADADAPAIVYPAAAIRGAREAAAMRFLTWLRGASAQQLFERAGFRSRTQDPSASAAAQALRLRSRTISRATADKQASGLKTSHVF